MRQYCVSEWDDVIDAYGLCEHADDVYAALGSAIRIETTWPKQSKQPRVGASRLGGLPDLPTDVEWPMRNGLPMQHVAQIDCAKLLESTLPDEGLLRSFSARSGGWAFDDMEKNCACVLYFEPGAQLERREPTFIEYEDEFRGKHAQAPILHDASALLKVSPIPSLPVPHTKETAWCSPSFAEAYSKAWHAGLLDAFPPRAKRGKKQDLYDHRLGGYVQEMDYSDEIKRGDVLLLCLASQSPFTWGDLDSVHFVVRDTDLSERRFDHVRVYNTLG